MNFHLNFVKCYFFLNFVKWQCINTISHKIGNIEIKFFLKKQTFYRKYLKT